MSPRNPRPVVMMTGGVPWPIALFLGFWRWVFRILYRHRSALAPVYFTLAVIVAGGWLHAWHPGVGLLLLAATAALCAVLSALPALVRLQGRPGVPQWLTRPAERLYVTLVTGVTGAFLSAAAEWGALAGPMPTLAWVAMAIMGVPWWLHYRRRARVQVESTIEAWPVIGESAGLPGSRIMSAVVGARGWSARILLRRGQTAADATSRIGALESAVGARPGGLRIEPDPRHADVITLRVLDTDPHARPIPLPDPTQLTYDQVPNRPLPGRSQGTDPAAAQREAAARARLEDRRQYRPGGQTLPADQSLPDPVMTRAGHIGREGVYAATINRPFQVGLWEDGTPTHLLLNHRHALIGGIAGSGKSGMVNVIMTWLALSTDVVIWGIDLKAGMELAPWLARISRLATRPEEATLLLAEAVEYLEWRARQLTAQGRREWTPTPRNPALVIVVDEYAELSEQAKAYADSIARRGRAPAVTLILATQRPSQAAMGNNAVRSQIDVRIGLRVREARDVDLIMGQGMLKAGWHLNTLDAPGKFLLLSPDNNTTRRARCYFMPDRYVTAVLNLVMTNFPYPPALPPLPRNEYARAEDISSHPGIYRVGPETDPHDDDDDDDADEYADEYAPETGEHEEYPYAGRDGMYYARRDGLIPDTDPNSDPNDDTEEVYEPEGQEYPGEPGRSLIPAQRTPATPETQRGQSVPDPLEGVDDLSESEARVLEFFLFEKRRESASIGELQTATGMNERTVFRHLAKLREKGWVERDGHGGHVLTPYRQTWFDQER